MASPTTDFYLHLNYVAHNIGHSPANAANIAIEGETAPIDGVFFDSSGISDVVAAQDRLCHKADQGDATATSVDLSANNTRGMTVFPNNSITGQVSVDFANWKSQPLKGAIVAGCAVYYDGTTPHMTRFAYSLRPANPDAIFNEEQAVRLDPLPFTALFTSN